MFARWAHAPDMPAYGSWGNGAAMRVSSIAWLASDGADALTTAARSAAVSHDHPDAVAGAEATVLAAWLARHGVAPEVIRREIADRFESDLSQSVEQIRAWYEFDISCTGTVPPAIVCALDASGYEDAIRNAVSLGATPTRSPASRAVSPKRSMAYRRRSALRRAVISTKACCA